jgi:hypothetical protein
MTTADVVILVTCNRAATTSEVIGTAGSTNGAVLEIALAPGARLYLRRIPCRVPALVRGGHPEAKRLLASGIGVKWIAYTNMDTNAAAAAFISGPGFNL